MHPVAEKYLGKTPSIILKNRKIPFLEQDFLADCAHNNDSWLK